MPLENPVSNTVIKAAIEVHRNLGPGLLESAYRSCLAYEFVAQGLGFRQESSLPVVYKGQRINCGFRTDFIVEQVVIVEVKAVDAISPVHLAQVLTYLRLSGCSLGLILNFNTVLMRDGIRRVVHNLAE